LKKRISDIVKIQTGIYEKPERNGEVYYVQARHFDNNRAFIKTVKPDLPSEARLHKHYLQLGDVLVAAKGYDHFAVAYLGIIKPAVASSMFIVLRLYDTENVLPEFLAWHINHPNTQNILSESSKGTSLPSITKSDVGDLEIFIPPVATQMAILEIERLMKKESNIILKLNNLREKKIQQLILNTLN